MAKTEGMLINLRHIEVFDAISTTGSTIAAAAQLSISQSNASRMLQQLEDYLGVTLFDRDKNRLTPTREGLQLGPEIRSISDRLRAIRLAAAEMERGRSREIPLRLAFPASLSVTLMPRLVKQFLAEHGPAPIEIASGTYLTIERMIADGGADLGFSRLPSQTPGLKEQMRLASRHVCVMARVHPLSERSSLMVEDLKAHDLILLNRERPARHELEALFYRSGVRRRPVIEVHSVGCACALAAEGLGIAIVSELIAHEHAALSLSHVPLLPELPVTYTIISSERYPLPKSAQLFLAILEKQMEQSGRLFSAGTVG
jgi:DNA-binding transcriptional LysR family regulator